MDNSHRQNVMILKLILSFVGLAVMFACCSVYCNRPAQKAEDKKVMKEHHKRLKEGGNKQQNLKKGEARRNAPKREISKTGGPYFPGLNASDIYLNLKKRGFDCVGPKSSKIGVSWYCQDERFSTRSWSVTIRGEGYSQLTFVTATSLNYGKGSSDEIAREFLGFVASLPYEGAEPAKAKAWVLRNVGKRNVSYRIGAARFELSSNARARILDISVVSDSK